MTSLRIYLTGCLVTFLCEIIIEHLYYGNGRAETVTIKDILEDLCIALFSWLGIIAVIIWLWGEWKSDFQMKGYGETLHDYEEKLKRETDNHHSRKQ